jgi:hypothetical protein
LERQNRGNCGVNSELNGSICSKVFEVKLIQP